MFNLLTILLLVALGVSNVVAPLTPSARAQVGPRGSLVGDPDHMFEEIVGNWSLQSEVETKVGKATTKLHHNHSVVIGAPSGKKFHLDAKLEISGNADTKKNVKLHVLGDVELDDGKTTTTKLTIDNVADQEVDVFTSLITNLIEIKIKDGKQRALLLMHKHYPSEPIKLVVSIRDHTDYPLKDVELSSSGSGR